MYITLFFFFTNNFLTSKSVIQEYLSPFRSSKVQNVSVLLRGGGGEGREKRGKRVGDACHLWLFNFRQGSNHFWLRIQNRIKYAIDGNENILEENQIQHHKNQELLMIAVLLLFWSTDLLIECAYSKRPIFNLDATHHENSQITVNLLKSSFSRAILDI